MIFDYENLRLVWWLLLGVLLIGFAVMDGFDVTGGIESHCLDRTGRKGGAFPAGLPRASLRTGGRPGGAQCGRGRARPKR